VDVGLLPAQRCEDDGRRPQRGERINEHSNITLSNGQEKRQESSIKPGA
jgi:hypothetical protein